jgi:hypothetical protein
MKTRNRQFAKLKPLAALVALVMGCFFAFLPVEASLTDMINRGLVSWENASEVITIGEERVLIFRDTSLPSRNKLKIGDTVKAKVRILVVGGGGAGGTSHDASNGAGGGGGAGGFLETNDVFIAGGVYVATVGVGGEKAADGTVLAEGRDGGRSSLILDGGSLSLIVDGGGGGGAASVGHNGASGGGGSRAGGTRNDGGLPSGSGLGFAGGRGSTAGYGAGGGGAAGPGAAPYSCVGGSGLQSDITGTAAYYCGGGGGGVISGYFPVSGGSGVGGSGGGALEVATDGTGYGSGGGGSGKTGVGGAGAHGIVIVRLIDANEVKVAVPAPEADLVWNGLLQTGVVARVGYSLLDGYAATAAGSYVARVMPSEGFTWLDGTVTTNDVVWQIARRRIDWPIGSSTPYTGNVQTGNVALVEAVAKGWVSLLSGSLFATNAGVYTVTATLTDYENLRWWNGTHESTNAVTFTWSISSIPVPPPTVISGWRYDSTNHIGVVVGEHMHVMDVQPGVASVTNAVEAGTYAFAVRLDNLPGQTNYVWQVTPPTADDWRGEWSIGPATNAVTALTLEGWMIGPAAVPNKPVCRALWGEKTAVFSYAPTAEAEVWQTTAPTNAGVWWVRAEVPAARNWETASAVAKFDLFDDPKKIFSDHVTLTLSGYSGTSLLSDFPVLVRLSEKELPGFSYVRAGATGENLMFLDSQKRLLPYEVDTWNPSGESLLWVRLFELKGKSTAIDLYWKPKPGVSGIPGSAPTKVWAGYAGVWHFNETVTPAAAAVTVSADSTANELSAKPVTGQTGANDKRSRMISVDGAIGLGRQIETAAASNGNRLSVDPSPALNLGGTFTVSGWVNVKGNPDASISYPLLSRKRSTAAAEKGWVVRLESSRIPADHLKRVQVFGSGSGAAPGRVSATDAPLNTTGWTYFSISYNGTWATIYGRNASGSWTETATIGTAAENNTLPLTFGGLPLGSVENPQSLWGQIDEFRLQAGAPSAAQLKDASDAVYQMVADPTSFTTPGFVQRDGLFVDRWVRTPDIQPRQWESGVTELKTTVFDAGALASGQSVTSFIYDVYAPTNIYARLSDLPRDAAGAYQTGLYRVVFQPSQSEQFEPLVQTIDVRIVGHRPYTGLSGKDGDSGRILLMNGDTMTASRVLNQGYADTGKTLGTYWEHIIGSEGALGFNLKRGAESILWTKKGARLWHLMDCRHGNTFLKGETTAGKGLSQQQNYLPWSKTSLDIEYGWLMLAANQSSVGQVVMRNKKDAQVVSSCFTNGVGTIYFDAVNGWTSADGEAYQLVVEIATNTVIGLEEGLVIPPTDDNCRSENESGDVDPYGNLAADGKTAWIRLPMKAFRVSGSTVAAPVETSCLKLDVNKGGTLANFYRVAVPLNTMAPLRFRIRRETAIPSSTWGYDEAGLILLDNIIVSYPAMGVDLTTTGEMDSKKKGSQLMGFERATTVPHPAVNDEALFARARMINIVTNDADRTARPGDFVAEAKMHYRWRYLDQKLGEWQSVALNPANDFRSLDPLKLPAESGDVEYWFESRLQAPFYQYVDYSGAQKTDGSPLGLPGYTEERSIVTNRCASADILPSRGRDWFFRLREGRSEWESVQILLDGALAQTNEMTLVGDDMWRALILVPTNVNGDCSLLFRGVNRRAPVTGSVVTREMFWGNSDPLPLERIPNNGLVSEDVDRKSATPLRFTLDHASNYLEVRVSQRFGTWSIARAEYQNFNNWDDAYTPPSSDAIFKENYAETNGVDDVMKKRLTLNASDWALFERGDTAWNEKFTLSNWNDPGFPRNIIFEEHLTPEGWNGRNLSFVTTRFGDLNNPDIDAGTGLLAAKLVGRGKGAVEYLKPYGPAGLEKVTLLAAIGHSATFDAISFDPSAYALKNYMFLSPVSMSQKIAANTTDILGDDMAMGAAVSLVSYYRQTKGCYEFRVERLHQGNTLRFSLYKWAVENGDIVDKRLCAQDIPGHVLWSNTATYYGAFISCANDVTENGRTGTRIVCGLAKTAAVPDPVSPAAPYDGLLYGGLVYLDADEPHTRGSYGVMSKDCSAKYMLPMYFTQPFSLALTTEPTTTASGGLYFKETMIAYGKNYERPYLTLNSDGWEFVAGRCEPFYGTGSDGLINNNLRGIRTPLNMKQDVEIWIKPRAGGEWKRAASRPVSSYALKALSFDIQTTEDCHLRIQAGSWNADVVVDQIEQFQWRAPDHEQVDYRSDGFVYTQGFVQNDSALQKRTITLQPTRGIASRPFSVRSPVLDGLGRIAFDYKNVDKNAEIWVQMATNKVSNLTGVGGYNNSITSVEPGEPQGPGDWITVAKYKYNDLTNAATKAQYFGFHNQPERPVRGVFRVVIPPTVAQKALEQSNIDYGKVTITAMTVTDEPALSDRAWRGWNLRTLGDPTDSEKRMYLMDTSMNDAKGAEEAGHGLSCALNNSLVGVTNDLEMVASENPSIVSPTFKAADGVKSGVGSVTFKARLYTINGIPATRNGGRVVLYGAANSVSGRWVPLKTFDISRSTFDTFEWTAGTELYSAVKFEVPEVTSYGERYDRVILEEITVGEKVQPTVAFVYARPFRSNLFTAEPVKDILSMTEQPLAGESWGVQTQLALKQMADEIDIERGFKVYLSYYTGESPWGYENWKNKVLPIPLLPVGDATNLLFRSVGNAPETLVPPAVAGGTVVQFQLRVEYYDRGGNMYTQYLTEWQQPPWYEPIDLNAKHKVTPDSPNYTPYTILDTVSPGRAWINEVNWNDGTPETTGNAVSDKQQYIEICVPSGVDLKGWRLRLTDVNNRQWYMAEFGTHVAARKSTAAPVNGYEFVVLESPETNHDGGIRDEANPAWRADGTWSIEGIDGTAPNGTLGYSYPFQFELVRPSGVIEHQFVMQGTNVWSHRPFGTLYYGTNLVAELDKKTPSSRRFYAGEEVARAAANPAAFGSSGVVGAGDVYNGPGSLETWKSALGFTPGRLNEGQTIPADWFVVPNGTNVWVYLTVVGDHLQQNAGGDTNRSAMIIVPQGLATNVLYTADPWYETAVIDRDGVREEVHRTGTWRYTFSVTGQSARITAYAGPDNRLVTQCKLDPADPYTPSVLRWLSTKYAAYGPQHVRLAHAKGLSENSATTNLSLRAMYWLDIPPVNLPPRENEPESDWWFRGGMSRIYSEPQIRLRETFDGKTLVLSNRLVGAKLYVSNAVTREAYAPQRLQGLDNARSDDPSTYSGGWTSAVFRIEGMLDNDNSALGKGYLPFRLFTFGPQSFAPKGDENEFETVIELIDPFSTESPGYSYGWSKYDWGTPAFFRWTISTNQMPLSVERLKAKDTYE